MLSLNQFESYVGICLFNLKRSQVLIALEIVLALIADNAWMIDNTVKTSAAAYNIKNVSYKCISRMCNKVWFCSCWEKIKIKVERVENLCFGNFCYSARAMRERTINN